MTANPRPPTPAAISEDQGSDVSMDGEPTTELVAGILFGGLLGVVLAIYVFTGGAW